MINDTDVQRELKVFENDENHIEFFRELALEYLNIDVDYVKDIMNQLIRISEERGYDVAKHWCILYLGWTENIRGNLIEAIKLHKKSMEFFESEDIRLGYGASYNALLVDYLQTGYLNSTIENCMKCIKFCETLNNSDLIVAVIINTIFVFLDHDYVEEAEFLLDRIRIFERDYRPDYEIDINIIKATFSLQKEQYEDVDKYCNEALKIAEKNNFNNWKNQIYLVMAKKCYKTREIQKGRKLFSDAINISKLYEDKFLEAKITITMGVCEFDIREYYLAKVALTNALKIMENKEYLGLKEKSNYYLSRIYEKFENYEDAYNALKNHLKYKKIITKDSELGINDLKYTNVFSAAEEYKWLYNKIDKISKLCKNITANLEIDKCTEIIYKEIKDLVATDYFAIALYDSSYDSLNYIILFEDNVKQENKTCNLYSENNLALYCLKEQTHILINDIEKEYSKYEYKCREYKVLKNSKFKSIIYIPLIIENNAIGIMTVKCRKANMYTVNELNELKILASYIAIAIRNLELFNKVRYFAEHDILTETYNRSKILTIGDAFNEKRKNSNLSIAMIDIDKFKNINDKYGHVTGDLILKNICGIIQENLGQEDLLGRYGGEEFLILFENKNKDESMEICENFRREIEQFEHRLEEYSSIYVTITIGVYQYQKGESFMEGIKKADKALYAGKENGRNRTILYSN